MIFKLELIYGAFRKRTKVAGYRNRKAQLIIEEGLEHFDLINGILLVLTQIAGQNNAATITQDPAPRARRAYSYI